MPNADLDTKFELARFPSEELSRDPFSFYAAGRAGGIHKIPGRDEFVLFRHDDISWVLSNEHLFSAYLPTEHAVNLLHYNGAKHLGAQDEPEHGPNRHLLSRPFTPGRLRDYHAMICSHVDQLIDAFAEGGVVELTTSLAYPLPALVMCSLMGLPTTGDDFDFLHRWTMAYTTGVAHDFEVFGQMHDFMNAQIEKRLTEPTDDILTDFLERQIARDGGYDSGLGHVFAIEMIAGGAVTTGQLIANAMVLLLRHPGEMARVRADLSLIEPMLEETMRLESPVQWMRRHVPSDIEINDILIPAGSTLTMVYASANRDAAIFPAPDEFQIQRPNVKRHLGFGLHTHFCLGAPLARLEARITFERLVARFSQIELAVGFDEIENIDSLHFRVPKAVPLALTPASPA